MHRVVDGAHVIEGRLRIVVHLAVQYGAEAPQEAEAIKDAIKAAMGDSEAVVAGEYKITWKSVTTARIDTSALKKALPEVAAAFTRETTVRRFCIA